MKMNEIIEYVTRMMKYGIKYKILGFETSEVGFETFYMEWEIVRQEGIWAHENFYWGRLFIEILGIAAHLYQDDNKCS